MADKTVTLTLPGGSVVHARPEVAARLAANGAVAEKPKRKSAEPTTED